MDVIFSYYEVRFVKLNKKEENMEVIIILGIIWYLAQ